MTAPGTDEEQHTSTWRQVLDEDWEIRRAITDWMGIPAMHEHVAEVQFGTRRAHQDWVAYSLDAYLRPMAERLGRGLSLVSFGSGPGQIEKAVLQRGWPIRRLVCREYDPALVAASRVNLAGLCEEQESQVFDYNQPEAAGSEIFDVAFFVHSMHHCTELERFLGYLNRVVADHGIILGLDYFGPSRLQISHEVKPLLDEIFASLPERLRRNLGSGQIEAALRVDTIAEVTRGDPSEAPRSADLRSLLLSTFPVREVSPMGGTLLRPLLSQRAGNFRDESDMAVLKQIMILERELIRCGRLQSDNLFFVLGKSDRI